MLITVLALPIGIETLLNYERSTDIGYGIQGAILAIGLLLVPSDIWFSLSVLIPVYLMLSYTIASGLFYSRILVAASLIWLIFSYVVVANEPILSDVVLPIGMILSTVLLLEYFLPLKNNCRSTTNIH